MRNRGTVAGTAVVVALIAMLVAVMAGQSPGAVKASSTAPVSAADSPTNVIGQVSTIEYKNHGTHGPVDVLGWDWTVKSPRDLATGQASGKRQFTPLVITKQMDAESIRLFQAVVTNENLPSVVLNIYRPNAGTDVYMRYTLTNAHVSQIHQGGSGVPETIPLEEVSFVFQKICLTYNPGQGQTQACDDWQASQ
jgi:type VI secretion system secreted protein Hcp